MGITTFRTRSTRETLPPRSTFPHGPGRGPVGVRVDRAAGRGGDRGESVDGAAGRRAQQAGPRSRLPSAAMELQQAIRRRRMVRNFDPRTVPAEVLERVVGNALRAPSAGFAQGWGFVVLEGPDQTAPFLG